MRKIIGVSLLLFIVNLCGSNAGGWPTLMCAPGSFNVHEDMAKRVLDHPTIAPYLTYFGLDRDAIASIAETEPQCYFSYHPHWIHLRDRDHLSWDLNDTTVGIILHVAADSGVASCHSPANEVWCDGTAESVYELSIEGNSMPALDGLYTGTYTQKMDTFHDDQIDLTNDFKYWWQNTWYCPLCDPDWFATTGALNGERFSQAVLLEYFECHKYIDIGLRIGGFAIAIEDGSPTSPLRIARSGTVYGVKLVDLEHPYASPIRVKTSSGIMALQEIP